MSRIIGKVWGRYELRPLLMVLFDQRGCELRKSTDIDAFMPFAFVAAVGGVGVEDVAVARFQLFQDTAFVYYSGATVVG